MPYSRAFFELQLKFARELAVKFELSATDAVRDYTTFTKSLGEQWEVYLQYLESSSDFQEQAELAYCTYLTHCTADPTPQDTHFQGHLLFGCFYYELRDSDRTVRPHFIKNESSEREGILAYDQMPVRKHELTAMFRHIRSSMPRAETVLGNSWMYNLQSYRRLFPPQYCVALPESSDGEFTFLARWGQFFDRDWKVKEPFAQVLFERLDTLNDLKSLRTCFPFPILQPHCATEHFYTFYGL